METVRSKLYIQYQKTLLQNENHSNWTNYTQVHIGKLDQNQIFMLCVSIEVLFRNSTAEMLDNYIRLKLQLTNPLTNIDMSILNEMLSGKYLQFKLHTLLLNYHNFGNKTPLISSSKEVIYLICSLGVPSSQF